MACAGVRLQGEQEEGAGSHSGYLAEQKTLQVIAGLGEPQLGDTGVLLKADILTFSDAGDGQVVAD